MKHVPVHRCCVVTGCGLPAGVDFHSSVHVGGGGVLEVRDRRRLGPTDGQTHTHKHNAPCQ